MEKHLLLYRDARKTDYSTSEYSVVKQMFNTVLSAQDAIAIYQYVLEDCYISLYSDNGTYVYKKILITNLNPVVGVPIDISDGDIFFIQNTQQLLEFNNGGFRTAKTSFPNLTSQIDIHEFTYSAERMGDAPTITATFYDFNCFDKEWNIDTNGIAIQRFNNIFTEFNGERFYLKCTPSSSFSNEDARYKHDLTFTSERNVLTNTLMFDTVPAIYEEFSEYKNYGINSIVTYNGLIYQFHTAHSIGSWDLSQVDRINPNLNPISESTTFSFFGSIEELAKRINASLVASDTTVLSTAEDGAFQEYHGYHVVVDPYDEFSTTENYEIGDIVIYNNVYYKFITNHTAGSWNTSEIEEFYFEEKLISIDNNTIKEALDLISSEYDYMYYFDENKIIHIREYQTNIENDIQYGVENELLSIERSNATDKIINRMTAVGSEDNIPYYYPNPMEDGFLSPVMLHNGSKTTNFNVTISDDDKEKFYNIKKSYIFRYGQQSDLIAFINESGIDQNNSHIYCTISASPLYTDKYLATIDILFTIDDNEDPDGLYCLFKYACNYDSIVNIPNTVPHLLQKKNSSGIYVNYFTTDQLQAFYDAITSDDETYKQLFEPGEYKWTIYQYMSTRPQHVTNNVNVHPAYYYPSMPYSEMFVDSWGIRYPEQTQTSFSKATFYEENNLTFQNGDWWKEDGTKATEIVGINGDYYQDINNPTHYYLCTHSSLYGYQSFDLVTDSSIYTNDTGIQFLQKYCKNTGLKAYSHGWISIIDKVKTNISLDDYPNIIKYGLTITGTVDFFDEIQFTVDRYITPCSNLMPELYIKTNGERRFYNAIQYPFIKPTGYILDENAGEYDDSTLGKVSNNHYKSDYGDFISFDNIYQIGKPLESIETFDDIKPSIKNHTYNNNRIDIIQEIAFDTYDSDELVLDNTDDDGESQSTTYRHPYFFVKLRPLGFNIFDMAIDEDEMYVNFTTGSCGACEFTLMVGENYKNNTVRIWREDAYTYQYSTNTYTKKYSQGDLMRYDDTKLYGLRGDEYVLLENLGIGYLPTNKSWGDVICTDIKVSEIEDTQKDTTDNYVWVCLQKDTSTFGTIMPSQQHNLIPKAFEDTQSETTADKFVFTHIKMPQTYIREAESELTNQLVRYMAKCNSELFSYQITFSRIFFAQNSTFENELNENSLLHIKYADHPSLKVYVSSFTYKMTNDAALPEITVNLKDPTQKTRYKSSHVTLSRINSNDTVSALDLNNVGNIAKRAQQTASKCVKKNGSSVINGNITVTGNLVGKVSTVLSTGETITLESVHNQNTEMSEVQDELSREMLLKANRSDTPTIEDFNAIRTTVGNNASGLVQRVQALTESVGDSTTGLIASVSNSLDTLSSMSTTINTMSQSISETIGAIKDDKTLESIGGLTDETKATIEQAMTDISSAATAIDAAVIILNNSVANITDNDVDKFIENGGVIGVTKSDIISAYSSSAFSKISQYIFGVKSTLYLTSITTEPLTAEESDIYYNSTDNKFYKYSDSAWTEYTVSDAENHTYVCDGTAYRYNGTEMSIAKYYRTTSDDDTAYFIKYDILNSSVFTSVQTRASFGATAEDVEEDIGLGDDYTSLITTALKILSSIGKIEKILDWTKNTATPTTYRYIYIESWGADLIATVRSSITGFSMLHDSYAIINQLTNGQIFAMYIVEYHMNLGNAMQHDEGGKFTYHGTFNDDVYEYIKDNENCTADMIIENFGGGEEGYEYMYTVEYLVSVGRVQTDGTVYWVK